jgi:hypothetical protein
LAKSFLRLFIYLLYLSKKNNLMGGLHYVMSSINLLQEIAKHQSAFCMAISDKVKLKSNLVTHPQDV